MQHKDLVIVTPPLAAPWGSCEEVLMIALHAQHSAATVPTWRERSPREALIVALTDTTDRRLCRALRASFSRGMASGPVKPGK